PLYAGMAALVENGPVSPSFLCAVAGAGRICLSRTSNALSARTSDRAGNGMAGPLARSAPVDLRSCVALLCTRVYRTNCVRPADPAGQCQPGPAFGPHL